MTQLIITPNVAKKYALFSGRAAAGEHAKVKIVGLADKLTSTLQLRVIAGGAVIAMFPQPVEEGGILDSWSTSGTDLTCELNLNTVQALEKCRAPETFCVFELEEIGDPDATPTERCPQLYFVSPYPVLGWPKRVPTDAPFNFDDYPSVYKTWMWQISNIAFSVTKSGKVATITMTDKNGNTTTETIADGENGQNGQDGKGVPPGGEEGDSLVKKSGADYDTEWRKVGGGGTGNYNELTNKPQINGNTLLGNQTAAQLGLVSNTNGSAVNLMLNTVADSEDSYFGVVLDTVGGVLAWSAEQNGPGGVMLGSWKLPHNSNGTPKFGTFALIGDIPALAVPSTESTAQGKAADAKLTADFVNSSINAMAAFYLTADAQGNAFATKAALTAATVFYNGGVARTPTKNDYLIVLADESKTTALGVNPTTRYVYDGSAWAFQYVVNNTSLTQAQVNAINSGITALLVSWLSTFKGTDTATTLQSLLTAIGGKQATLTFDSTPTAGSANPVTSGGVKAALDGKVDTNPRAFLVGDQYGQFVELNKQDAEGDPTYFRLTSNGEVYGYNHTTSQYTQLYFQLGKSGTLALTSELPYAKSTSAIGTRQVYTFAATTATTITLPTIPNTDEVLNCDIVVNGTGASADFGLTLVGGTGVAVYFPDGEGITCKAGCVTMVSCVGINGLGWLVVGCNNLATAS